MIEKVFEQIQAGIKQAGSLKPVAARVGPFATLQNGLLTITPTQPSGNDAEVVVQGPSVVVTVNGQSLPFPLADVHAVFYSGAFGGSDMFANHTPILCVHYGWLGNNDFTTGTGQDYLFLWGNGNVVHHASGFAVAYTHGGKDQIDPDVLVF